VELLNISRKEWECFTYKLISVKNKDVSEKYREINEFRTHCQSGTNLLKR